ncbi:hypothetical protein ACKTEK_01280 [Tepidamorphus sp. 3E244]|uniref:hypothetical protein n=1 Tax=Tepidamorphus sp. 3E244 TaxID=3385498 RepID=UPI0038FC559E
MTIKDRGVGAKHFTYFYYGFEETEDMKSYEVPDGMTDMKIYASKSGAGFFFNKLDTDYTVHRHDTFVVEIERDQITSLSASSDGMKFPKFGDLKDAGFDAFRQKISDNLMNPAELEKLIGRRSSSNLALLLEKAQRLDQFRVKPDNMQVFDEMKSRLDRCDAVYSKFPVVSCIVNQSGNKYFGVNIENVSFPAGICAESGALASMIADSGAARIQNVYLYTPNDGSNIVPCGVCLQRLSPYSNSETSVTCFAGDRINFSGKFTELLTAKFSMNS